jgi:hypothetical protein
MVWAESKMHGHLSSWPQANAMATQQERSIRLLLALTNLKQAPKSAKAHPPKPNANRHQGGGTAQNTSRGQEFTLTYEMEPRTGKSKKKCGHPHLGTYRHTFPPSIQYVLYRTGSLVLASWRGMSARRFEDRLREIIARMASAPDHEWNLLAVRLQSALTQYNRINQASMTLLSWPNRPRDRRGAS